MDIESLANKVNDLFLSLTDHFTPLSQPTPPMEIPEDFLVTESEVVKALASLQISNSRGTVYMSLYAFHSGQIISTVLRQVDHDDRHGNAARTPIWDETSETDHTQKRSFRHSAIYLIIKDLAILRCLYGSEMVLLGVVIGKFEMPGTDISQENEHAILIVNLQFVTYKFK
jgi:hypothetical protein